MTTLVSSPFTVSVAGTPLAAAASSLSSGASSEFASGAPSAAMVDLAGGSGSIYQWAVRFYFANGKGWNVNKAPSSSSPTRIIEYDEITNVWTNRGDYFLGDFGHAYDGLTVDETNSYPYFHRWGGDTTIMRWVSSAWESQSFAPGISTIDGAYAGTTTSGFAWAPNLFGASSPGIVCAWENGAGAIRMSDWTLVDIADLGATALGIHTLCFYWPSQDCVIWGGGNNSNNLYRIDNGPTNTGLIGAAPIGIA
jgi:hypothetical protein